MTERTKGDTARSLLVAFGLPLFAYGFEQSAGPSSWGFWVQCLGGVFVIIAVNSAAHARRDR